MKKAIIYTILLVVSIIAISQIINHATNTCQPKLYAMTCKIVELDRENDLVILADANGFEWTWEHIEDWQIGDCASLLMDDNGTAEIFDDTIKSMTYNAWELS